MHRVVATLAAVVFAAAAFAENFGPLVGKSYGWGDDAVLVFLHGDVSRGGPATYHEQVMSAMAPPNGGITAIALLRPGYNNGWNTSPGNNFERWDQYTSDNNDLVAQALQFIRDANPDRPLVVTGHSGGAAQLAAVIGRYPGIVDTAILVSCPCHFTDWRRGFNRQLIRSADQSPEMHVDGIDPATRIVVITGALDDNTTPALAEDYASRTLARGIDTRLLIVPGADHWNDVLIAVVKEEMTEALQ
ncbi:MAG: pimeloyl-ACP methyl ester carboxylesterase [Paracoccaceae bacterium]|jgi:pimeloyl-ACP methyl ester carboxylesterase